LFVVVIVLSLLAALAYGVASVLQQHAAYAVGSRHSLRPSLIAALLHRPLWILGMATSGVGLVLQLAALSKGSLTIVQPLLVLGLLFALPIAAVTHHRQRLSRLEWFGAGAVCLGVTLFLLACAPRPGRADASPLGWAVVLACSALLSGLLVLAGFAATKHPGRRAALLGGAGGVLNGLSAGFSKGLADLAARSLHAGIASVALHLATSWLTYALLASLAGVLLLIQSAFQAGPLAWSLGAITAVNPLVGIAIGVGAFGESLAVSALSICCELLGLGLGLVGIVALSRSRLPEALPAGEVTTDATAPFGPLPLP